MNIKLKPLSRGDNFTPGFNNKMAYDALITMVSRFYTRESLRKSYEEDATNLENFIKNVQEINKQETELNSVRLNAQVKGLTGANNPDFKEFIMLSSFFDPSTMVKDYRVFSQYRRCFSPVFNEDNSKIIKLNIDEIGQKKRKRDDKLMIIFLLLAIFIHMIFAKPGLTEWLINDWSLPKIVAGVSLNLIILFLITVIFRVYIDMDNYAELKRKIEKLNPQ